jgi:SH3-like domain-containing protein
MRAYHILYFALVVGLWSSCSPKQQATGGLDSTATVAAPAQPQEKWMVLKYDDMRLRETPSKAGAVLATFKEGTQVLDLGDRSDNTETIEFRGEKVTDRWAHVRSADGKEGWIFGGALAPAADASVATFSQALEKLPLGDCKSIQTAMSNYAQAMKGKPADVADQAVVPLIAYLDKIAESVNTQLGNRADEDDLYLKFNPVQGQKMEPKYKAERDAWEACGLELTFPEGILYLALKPGLMIPTLEPLVSKSMRRYLEIRKKEESHIWTADGGLTITPMEVADRAVTWDVFLADNPDFAFKKDIEGSKINYLACLLVGADNTPAFDYDSGKLLGTEFKEAWEWVLKSNPKTETGKVVQEWWNVLKSENWKRGPKSEKYIQAFWKAHE